MDTKPAGAATEPPPKDLSAPKVQQSPAPPAEELPLEKTIREHVEGLEPWKLNALLARLNGERALTGEAADVSIHTRMGDKDFAAALDRALHGRV